MEWRVPKRTLFSVLLAAFIWEEKPVKTAKGKGLKRQRYYFITQGFKSLTMHDLILSVMYIIIKDECLSNVSPILYVYIDFVYLYLRFYPWYKDVISK